jgi:hypothetical protein
MRWLILVIWPFGKGNQAQRSQQSIQEITNLTKKQKKKKKKGAREDGSRNLNEAGSGCENMRQELRNRKQF